MFKVKAKIKDYYNSLETRDIYAVCLLLLSLSLLFLKFNISLVRLFSAVCDFGRSIAYWFVFIFGDVLEAMFGQAPSVEVTVMNIPEINVQRILPFSISELNYKLDNLIYGIFDADMFRAYNIELFNFLFNFGRLGSVAGPAFFVALLIFKEIILSDNDKELGYVSPGVVFFDKIVKLFKAPALFLFENFKYIYKNKKYFYLFVFIWAVNLNVVTLIFEILAYYYYFISSFDIFSIGKQFVKFVYDFTIMFFSGTVILWIVLGYVFFDIYRKRKGMDVLRHNEAKNCGFAKIINLCSLVVGPMGLGKTTFVTDLILCLVNIFKTKSKDIIYDHDLLFPMFPWELFERDIKDMTITRQAFNPVSIDLFVDVLEEAFERTPSPSVLYNYDYDTYGLKKNVGHNIVTLFDVMRTYGKAYFVYINENPSLSNYPIRFDGKFSDSKFLPLWNGDFFSTVPGETEDRYSHILDQDLFRLGKPVEEDNPLAGTFSWGLYSVMEFGKSQKNQLESQGIDANAEESNQKNDLYEYALKVCRHANVMIDNFVFFRFIADDQRPQSIPAKIRDCFSIITIVERSEIKLAMPFFGFESWLYDKVYEPFKEFYYKYRDKRGDRTLYLVLLKFFVSLLSNYYKKIYNRFGYFELDVALEAGTTYGEGSPVDRGAEIHKYYLAVKKIYAKRYSTDALSGFFSKKQLEAAFGMDDYDTYASLKMTTEEMQKQHERYIIELMQIMVGEKEPARASSVKRNYKKSSEKEEMKFEWDFI